MTTGNYKNSRLSLPIILPFDAFTIAVQGAKRRRSLVKR